jgi:hypothetical protein
MLPFLQPDFVLLTKSGKVVLNPYPEDQRAPKLMWHFEISGYSCDAGRTGRGLGNGEKAHDRGWNMVKSMGLECALMDGFDYKD